MQRVRRRLPWIVGAWLLCQAAAVASAPLALWRTAPTISVEDDCCPGVAPGQMCPMHHTKEGTRKCVVRGACDTSHAALLALSGGLGLPSLATSPIVRPPSADRIALSRPTTIVRAARPESPPPRA
jgi:hypothetical protein